VANNDSSPSGSTLDLRGIPCPANAARALLQLSMLPEGDELVVFVDDGEPIENVSRSIEVGGHVILSREREGAGWRLLVRAG
jgi:TusA-related sulfurtransferase